MIYVNDENKSFSKSFGCSDNTATTHLNNLKTYQDYCQNKTNNNFS